MQQQKAPMMHPAAAESTHDASCSSGKHPECTMKQQKALRMHHAATQRPMGSECPGEQAAESREGPGRWATENKEGPIGGATVNERDPTGHLRPCATAGLGRRCEKIRLY